MLSTALLAATSYAKEEPVESSSSSSADAKSTPFEEPTPVGALWTAKWGTVDLQPYSQKCLNRNTYSAKIYRLSERTHPSNPQPFLPLV